jgi:uncharacterized membrane protein
MVPCQGLDSYTGIAALSSAAFSFRVTILAMVALIILLVLFSSVVPILVIALLVSVGNLRSRVQNLEDIVARRIQAPSGQPQAPSVAQVISPVQQVPVPAPSEPVVTITEVRAPDAGEKFVTWFKEDWLLKLGAMLLLIGFGWLTTYAFLHNWIGPMGRISLGLGAGTLILILGWWRMLRYTAQGAVFLVLGSTVILLTTYAAREVYDFFNPVSSLAIMFLSTAFVAFASVVFDRRPLGIASVLLAGIAPMLTAWPTWDYLSLYTYIAVVIMGSVWIAVWKGHREILVASLFVFAAYSFPVLVGLSAADKDILILFAYGFAALFYLTNTLALFRLKSTEAMPDMFSAGLNGLLLLAWIIMAAPAEWQSLIISAWAVVFLSGAFLTFKISGRHESFVVYAGVAIAFVVTATTLELDGPTLVIAYTIETALVAILTHLITRDVRVALRLSGLLFGPAILALPSMVSAAWRNGILHDDFFVLLFLTGTMMVLGFYFRPLFKNTNQDDSKKINNALFIVGSLYAYVLIWLSFHAALANDDTAVMFSLAIFTVIGIASYVYGVTFDRRVPRTYGGALLVGVVARLLLVDVWEMAIAGRIATFFLIGTLLMSTAFLGRKRGQKIIQTSSETKI